MATNVSPAEPRRVEIPKISGEMRHVARQPIMDLNRRVHGYEVLFRQADGPEQADADRAARTMLDNAVLYGMEWLTDGAPAFVACTAEALIQDLVLVLAPRTTVLGIPGSMELTPTLQNACLKLKTSGFRLTLDDFTWKADLRPLAQMADYIRLDFGRFGAAERQYLRDLKDNSVALIAKNVETQDDYETARSAGFTLFQGGYLCQPVLLKKRKLPANHSLHFEIVRLLHHDPLDLHAVSQLVLRDASLTYRLLRLVNSPLYAIRQQIRNMESAIMVLGENAFRRIVSLAVLSEMNGEGPMEILHMALLRGRFCELAAGHGGLDASEQYLLGMLSLAPAMLHLPMAEIAPSLPFRRQICEALEGEANRERCLLKWLEFHERGKWDACDRIAEANSLKPEKLMVHYAASVRWAREALRNTI